MNTNTIMALQPEKTISSALETTPAAANGRDESFVHVSVIVPIMNMGGEVHGIYNDLCQGMQAYRQTFEIIFVDDASTDNTWLELEKLARQDAHVKLIRMRSSFGETSALDAGLKHALGQRIVFAAARVRVNLKSLPKFLMKMDSGYDLVVGWRTPRKDSGLNRMVSRCFNWLVQRFGKLQLHDINSSVIATTREVLDNIIFYGDLNIFIPVLAARKGYRVTEEQIEQQEGTFRKSRYVSEYIQRMLDIVAVIFVTKYSKKPLHFLGFFGFIFTLVGAGMSAYLFFYRIFGFGAIAGRPLLLLSVLLLVIGLQMISIGLIGEMITYTHAREQKEYNIETVIGA